MLHGTTCYRVLNVTWYYMLHGTTKCFMLIHVNVTIFNWVLHVTHITYQMVLNATWYMEKENLNSFSFNTII